MSIPPLAIAPSVNYAAPRPTLAPPEDLSHPHPTAGPAPSLGHRVSAAASGGQFAWRRVARTLLLQIGPLESRGRTVVRRH